MAIVLLGPEELCEIVGVNSDAPVGDSCVGTVTAEKEVDGDSLGLWGEEGGLCKELVDDDEVTELALGVGYGST